MKITAGVLRDPEASPTLESIEIGSPHRDEVRVRIESAGICATDIHAGGLVHAGLLPLPAVLGHEGAGIVEEVGDAVDLVSVGDKVAIVFDSCGVCRQCVRNEPSYCDSFNDLNFRARRPDGTTSLSADGSPIGSHFLGQSSFAPQVITGQRSLVRLDDDVDLRPIGPFGCGFLTGAGAVLNDLRPRPGSAIAVFGAGPVGLAGIMAARISGCAEIIAVDLSPERLEIARRVGATATVDATDGRAAEHIRDLVPGGVDTSLESTGFASVVQQAVGALAFRGRCGIVGVGPDLEMTLDWRTMLAGRSVTGITSGSAAPRALLPELVEHHRAGRFPVEEFITYYPFDEFERAFEDTRSGRAVKAVLTF